ncbi:MAG TPA: FAD-dependent monooxygenase [Ramlibacter sp.]|nr:FAD-dependent monooxygenase [Ramlibacter sp.]
MNRGSVLVVGAGPVGLLNALGLARQGVQVELLEGEPAIVDSPRAMVYHWSVLDGLKRLGVLDDAEQIGFRKQDYCYLVFKTNERIEWSLAPLAEHTAHPYNLHLGQNKLAEIVLAHLMKLPNFRVNWNTRVTGLAQDADGVTVLAESAGQAREFRAGWLIGADGARSAVRQALDLPFEGMTWPERFVATNIRYDFERHGYARSTLMIDDQYGAIIAKIDETGLWRCTYCESAELPEDEVLQRMPEVFKVLLPGAKGLELVQHSPYRMHQRSAPRYRVGRVLLAGDAAHATNPTGGLGLTSGLFDTFVLCEALAAVIHGEADDEVLDRYSDERRRVFLEIASPQASENKRLIYHSNDAARLDQDLQRLRSMATSRDVLLERLLFTRRLITPSLLGRSALAA